jgi:phage shock protein PspC (stress-responsive transcriptional regulator)
LFFAPGHENALVTGFHAGFPGFAGPAERFSLLPSPKGRILPASDAEVGTPVVKWRYRKFSEARGKGKTMSAPVTTRRLSRPRYGRMIGGVCAGLAQRWGMKTSTVRLLAVLSCLLPGPQFVAYLIMWAIIPSE